MTPCRKVPDSIKSFIENSGKKYNLSFISPDNNKISDYIRYVINAKTDTAMDETPDTAAAFRKIIGEIAGPAKAAVEIGVSVIASLSSNSADFRAVKELSAVLTVLKAQKYIEYKELLKKSFEDNRKEALEAGLKKADNAILIAANHTDDSVKLPGTQIDESSGIFLRRADDIKRLGIRQGDDIIYDFNKIHNRIIAKKLTGKTDNVITANAIRMIMNQGNNINYKDIPKTKGRWSGVPGDSTFFPDLDYIPKQVMQLKLMYNPPETWKEIGEQNLERVRNISELLYEERSRLSNNFEKFISGEIGFTYRGGEPDFTDFAILTLDIRLFGYDRILIGRQSRNIPSGQGKSVIELGDELLARNWPTTDITNFRSKWSLTWHERIDMHTIDLIADNMHNLITHRGGQAAVKKLN